MDTLRWLGITYGFLVFVWRLVILSLLSLLKIFGKPYNFQLVLRLLHIDVSTCLEHLENYVFQVSVPFTSTEEPPGGPVTKFLFLQFYVFMVWFHCRNLVYSLLPPFSGVDNQELHCLNLPCNIAGAANLPEFHWWWLICGFGNHWRHVSDTLYMLLRLSSSKLF